MSTANIGLTVHTGDVAEGTTVDTANVADPVATEVTINAIKREKIFVGDTVESMENHAKRNAMSVDKWDVGQLNTL